MSDDEACLLPVKLGGHMLERADISTWMTDAGGFDVPPGLMAADRPAASSMSLLSAHT